MLMNGPETLLHHDMLITWPQKPCLTSGRQDTK